MVIGTNKNHTQYQNCKMNEKRGLHVCRKYKDMRFEKDINTRMPMTKVEFVKTNSPFN